MPDGPVQLIIDPDRFRDDRHSSGGGGGKDFFAGRDAAFADHRQSLAESLRSIRSNYTDPGQLITLLVVMRPDALAKSHRPFSSIFAQSLCSHVGTEGYGELIMVTSVRSLRSIETRIRDSETGVRARTLADGTVVAAPTVKRCETGAIQAIGEWSSQAHRDFNLSEAVDWLSSSRGGNRIVVEFHGLPHIPSMRSAMLAEQLKLGALFARYPSSVKVLASPGQIRALEAGGLAQQPRSLSAGGDMLVMSSSDVRDIVGAAEANKAVKRVRLQEQIDDAPQSDAEEAAGEVFPSPSPHSRPRVGIIDGGVSTIVPCIARMEYVANVHASTSTIDHGTRVGGLVVLGSALNPYLSDPDCEIVDLRLFPDPAYGYVYYSDMDDFIEQLRADVQTARDEFGVRVFNMSWNLRRPLGATTYSTVAAQIDALSLELDVIFVFAAGNLSASEKRIEWPSNALDALRVVAAAGVSGVLAPSESLANVSVGAVNPPDMVFEIEGAPAPYSRRSLRIPSAVKPDLAHYGGASPSSARMPTGLLSVAVTGNPVQVQGTSYAAPLVAKYLANLDSAIAGHVPREVLIAMAVHFANHPPILRVSKQIREVAASFVGYGIPSPVSETLDGVASQMTVVISDVLLPGKRVELPFTWPQSLVTATGACRGEVSLTLVARPHINFAHGQERVRINIEAALKQADAAGKFKSKTDPTHTFFSGLTSVNERNLATELGKWFPIKSYRGAMPNGHGVSSDWRLDVDYLTRAGESFPEAGVEFAAVLTIADIDGSAPVFEEMRRSFTTLGIRVQDLTTAVNIGVRTNA